MRATTRPVASTIPMSPSSTLREKARLVGWLPCQSTYPSLYLLNKVLVLLVMQLRSHQFRKFLFLQFEALSF